jgi:hypothetical protein
MARASALWAVALLCLVASSVRADPSWTFTWTSPDSTIFASSGTSALSLFPSSGHGSGSSDIVAANLQAISTAPGNQPDPFNGRGYTLNLHLVDDASGQFGDLKFTGHFGGSLSSKNVGLTNTFEKKTGRLSLGGHTYAVTLHSYTPPGLPGSTLLGTLGGSLSMDGGGVGTPPPSNPRPASLLPTSPPPVAKAPEPSGIALAGLALSCLGVRGWCRRKKAGPTG